LHYKNFTSLLLFCCFLFISCDKEKSDVTPNEPYKMIEKVEDFTDSRDGQVYPVIRIGEQYWMGKNLNFNVSGKSFHYNDDDSNEETYGRLYLWDALSQAIPVGWHLPTDEEWKTLEDSLGMSNLDLDKTGYSTSRGTDEGTKLYIGGESMLDIPYSGFRDINGNYSAIDNRTYLWVNTLIGSDPYRRRIEAATNTVYRFTNPTAGFAITVRLVKD
jgi:uncharacterized protein (TIGR02145 family)